jgi:acylphosphatase
MAKAEFIIEGEVQKVGFRANLISFASEACILCKIKNFSDNPSKVFVLLEAETEELQAFYNKIKIDDIRVKTKLKTVIGYKVIDIEWYDRDRAFSWGEYYSMVQAEAGLKTMAAIERVEEKIKKLTAEP